MKHNQMLPKKLITIYSSHLTQNIIPSIAQTAWLNLKSDLLVFATLRIIL